jgi:hypothetical protein
MAVVRQNKVIVGTEATTVTTLATPAFNATTGNHITVCIRNRGAAISSVVDTAGNTYTQRQSDATVDPNMFLYTADNITGNASNVVTVTQASQSYSWVIAVEYSGLAASAYDTSGKRFANYSGTDVTSSGDITTANSGELVLLFTSENAFRDYTAGTDFTLIDGSFPTLSANHFGGAEEYIVSGTLSSYTGHITDSGSTAQNHGVMWVALKAAAGAAFIAHNPVEILQAVNRASTY